MELDIVATLVDAEGVCVSLAFTLAAMWSVSVFCSGLALQSSGEEVGERALGLARRIEVDEVRQIILLTRLE